MVSGKFACCPALMVIAVGENASVKSGGAVMVVRSPALSLARFSSPPPATVVVFVTELGAVVATETVAVTTG